MSVSKGTGSKSHYWLTQSDYSRSSYYIFSEDEDYSTRHTSSHKFTDERSSFDLREKHAVKHGHRHWTRRSPSNGYLYNSYSSCSRDYNVQQSSNHKNFEYEHRRSSHRSEKGRSPSLRRKSSLRHCSGTRRARNHSPKYSSPRSPSKTRYCSPKYKARQILQHSSKYHRNSSRRRHRTLSSSSCGRYDDRQWSQYSPASLRQSYRHTKRRTRTPSLSPSRNLSRNYQSLRNLSSNGHSRSSTGRRHQESKQFHSRHGDYVYSSTNRSRRHYSPTSSSCSSSSDNESSNSDSQYTSDDSFHSSGSSSDDCYFSPERHCLQPYRRRLLYEKYHHDQEDRLYHQPRSLLLSETGKDKSYIDNMPEVEDRDNRDFKATRKLIALDDTPVTRNSSFNMFKQEFLHRLDNIIVWPSLYYQEVRCLQELDSATSL